jgi:hypothetical protein
MRKGVIKQIFRRGRRVAKQAIVTSPGFPAKNNNISQLFK